MTRATVETLLKRRDFVRVQNASRKRRGKRLVILKDRSISPERLRVGYTVSKRVGNAVVRNRVKRRLKEIVRALGALLEPGWDYVVIARPQAASADYRSLLKDFECQLRGLQS